LTSRIRRLSKSLSRKQGSKKDEKKSKNFKNAKLKLAKLHARVTRIRNNETHKLTTMLTNKYDVIGIERLNVKKMVGKHHLARAILDMSFFEFRRQIEYKAKITGSVVVVADEYFASSKKCSNCGTNNDKLTLTMREWVCPVCGSHHDRDVNAAINLRNNAVSYTVSACGELAKIIASTKQELNSTSA
jgi:putative transposase